MFYICEDVFNVFLGFCHIIMVGLSQGPQPKGHFHSFFVGNVEE